LLINAGLVLHKSIPFTFSPKKEQKPSQNFMKGKVFFKVSESINFLPLGEKGGGGRLSNEKDLGWFKG